MERPLPVTRARLEARERERLHRLAQHVTDSRGRRHAQPPHEYRTDFQRDRDRLLHATAFRRLEYKTQVFHTLEPGGGFRTRLTHTLEVAQTARVIGTALGFNEDLIETIAYAHDIGHPPYGHAGEAALMRLMAEALVPAGPATEGSRPRSDARPAVRPPPTRDLFAQLDLAPPGAAPTVGFDHNAQALRIVDLLERRYPAFPGLNLTFEARAGLLKHGRVYKDCAPSDVRELLAFSGPHGSIEARIVDLADRLSYLCHDLEDALVAGVLGPDDLDEIQIVQFVRADRRRQQRAINGDQLDDAQMRFILIRDLKDTVVTDLVHHSAPRLSAWPNLPTDGPIVDYSPPVRRMVDDWHNTLFERYYLSERVRARVDAAAERIGTLFHALLGGRLPLPDGFADRIRAHQHVSDSRVACDYIASLTDRTLTEHHLEHPPTRRG